MVSIMLIRFGPDTAKSSYEYALQKVFVLRLSDRVMMRSIVKISSNAFAYCCLCLLAAAQSGASVAYWPNTYNIVEFGAKADGGSDSSTAISKAIGALADAGGGTVYVPPGVFLTGPIEFVDNMTLYLEAGAVLRFSTDFDDYYPLKQVRIQGIPLLSFSPLIYGRNVNNISIRGQGTLDGQGQVWHDFLRDFREKWGKSDKTEYLNKWQKEFFEVNHPVEPEQDGFMRPQLIHFYECRDIVMTDVRLRNSPFWTCHFALCEDLSIRGIDVFNPPGFNPDGVTFEACRNVRLSDSHFDVRDDGIALKAGKRKPGVVPTTPCENVTITNCTVVNGAAGFAIGSEMSGGVRNVTVSNCVFRNTGSGIHIKTRRGRGGIVEDIRIDNIVIKDSKKKAAILVDMLYWRPTSPEEVSEQTPILRDLHFSNIRSSGNKGGIVLRGLEELPLSNVTFTNIDSADATGIEVENVSDLRIQNVIMTPDSGSAFKGRHVEGLSIEDFGSRKAFSEDPLLSLFSVQAAKLGNTFVPQGVRSYLELVGEENRDVFVNPDDRLRFADKIEFSEGAKDTALLHWP